MQKIIKIKTNTKQEIMDITEELNKFVEESKVKEGILIAYTPHATASLIINENADKNICKDLLNCLNSLIPQGKWLHDKIDNNGAAHLKSSILGCSIQIPVKDNKLQLGRWQSSMLCEFDGPRERNIILTIQKTL
jgi:secondary thiamine-phosphate synthase enzyme